MFQGWRVGLQNRLVEFDSLGGCQLYRGDDIRTINRKSERMLQVEQTKGEDIEEVLRRMFVDENKLTQTIADELSISYVTAFKWLRLAGIHSRKLDI